jgi:response regulator RpfG family c-di-GMP phosphodiesterase
VVNSPTENPFAHGAHDMAFFSSTPLTSTALGVAEDIVGVLNVTERVDGHPFEPQELEYLDIVANIAGSAIHGVLTGEARDQARQSIMVALARLAEYRDVDTGRHVDRVTTYCAMLARELRAMGKHTDEISEGFIQDLVRAVPLHDIGKVAVPDQILLKPGHLTEEEMAIMRTHSEIGAGTIRSVIAGAPGVPFLHMAEEIAYGHHEWFNGSGYPRGIKGGDIPLTARIAAVADVYDALTTRRPYKDPFSHQRAASIIKQNAGTQFDPAVVDAFLKREKEFARLAVDLGDESATGGESAGDRSTEHIELVPAR